MAMMTTLIPGDTRESAAIYIARHLLDEGAHLDIYDPKVTFLSSPSPSKKHKRSQVFHYCPHFPIIFQVSEHQVRMELAGVSEDPARWENSSLSRLPGCQEWESLEVSSFCLKSCLCHTQSCLSHNGSIQNIFHRVERLVTCHTDPYSAAVSGGETRLSN